MKTRTILLCAAFVAVDEIRERRENRNTDKEQP